MSAENDEQKRLEREERALIRELIMYDSIIHMIAGRPSKAHVERVGGHALPRQIASRHTALCVKPQIK